MSNATRAMLAAEALRAEREGRYAAATLLLAVLHGTRKTGP
jgi:hypothetical protein